MSRLRLPWLRLPSGAIPLRIPIRAFWLCGIALGVFSLVVIVGSPLTGYVDFPHFWSAGRTVGTPDLFDPALRRTWGDQYGMNLSPWVYPPGAAWLFVPFGIWPIDVAFWLHAVAMAALVAASGLLGARTYGLDPRVGLAVAFAWTPSMASAVYGQNVPLALLFSLLTVEGLRRDSDVLAGLGVGLLLYKPTLAWPLLGLLLLRRRWRALAVVAACAAVWYVTSVAAAAGDWAWPRTWLSSLGGWYVHDTSYNTVRTISVPALLQGLGAPTVAVLGLGLAMVALALPRLLRAPLVQAGTGAILVGLAVSPHALNWEGALVLPALLWAMSGNGLREPARTWLVAGACLIAPEYLVSETVGLSVLVAITFAGAAIWIGGWWRAEGAEPSPSSLRLAPAVGEPLHSRNPQADG